jgi:hypothetical protein
MRDYAEITRVLAGLLKGDFSFRCAEEQLAELAPGATLDMRNVEGGMVAILREEFSRTYCCDVMTHPALSILTDDDRRAVYDACRHTFDGCALRGGCREWAPGQFLAGLATTLNLGRAFRDVLAEDNFISRAILRHDSD